jgi:5,10-methylenetetrahydromethanopterin reductase
MAKRQAITAAASAFDFATFGVWDDLGDPAPWRMLHALAEHPGNARIGPECLALPKYAAMDGIVSELAILEQLRPGRVFLGLAGGAWLDEMGQKRATAGQLREAVEAIRYLILHRTEGYAGRYYTLKPGFELNFAGPSASLPILIGGWGEAMAGMAGEVADELKIGGSASPRMVELVRRRAQAGAAKVGRPLHEPRIVIGAVTVVDEDGRLAVEVARRRAAAYIAVIGRNDPGAVADFPTELEAIERLVRAGDVDSATKSMPDALLRRFAFCGSPQEVMRQAEAALEAGAARVEFGSPHGLDEIHGIELIGREVLPDFLSR